MTEIRHLITEKGEVFELHGLEIRRYLGFYGSSTLLAETAVTAYGFVYVEEIADGTRIWLRPDHFPFAAYNALITGLIQRRRERIRVIFDRLSFSNPNKIAAVFFHNFHDARAYLDALRGLTHGEIERPQFLSTELDLKRLQEFGRDELKHAVAAWNRAGRELKGPRLKALMDDPRGADLLLTRRSPRNSEMLIETWPAYMGFVPEEKISGILGNPVEGLPYPGNYPVDAAVGYRTALKKEQPILELIDAEIKYIGGPVRRVRYERLCLPWRGKGGEIFISSLSSFRSKAVVSG